MRRWAWLFSLLWVGAAFSQGPRPPNWNASTTTGGTSLWTGATAFPANPFSVWPWQSAKVMIAGTTIDTLATLAIVGDPRAGPGSELASTYFGPNGEIVSNRFILLYGSLPTHSYDPSSMMEVGMDTAVGITVKGTQFADSDGGTNWLYTGGGPSNAANNFLRSFSVGNQGTMELDNVYSVANYAPPQIILGEIFNPNSPAWTYSGINQDNGVLKLGTYNKISHTLSPILKVSSTGIDATGYKLNGTAVSFPIVFADSPNSTINIAAVVGSPATLISKTLNIASGDQIILRVKGAIINNSGVSRTYTIQFNIGADNFPLAFASGSITASATNRNVIMIEGTFGVHSTSSVWFQGDSYGGGGAALGTAANINGNISRFVSGQTGNNDTGSQTVSMQIYADANTATQSFELVSWSIEQRSTNP